jgi:hypothetical protein
VFRAGFSAGRKKSRSGERLGESARAIRANGSALRLHVLRQSAERQHAARNYVVLTPTNSGTFYFANQQLRMYSIIGATVSGPAH